jgi:hypothetical protein
MNTEVPTPLDYATPVQRVYWRWGWWRRFGVAAVTAIVHLGLGLVISASDLSFNDLRAVVLLPVLSLIEWLRMWPMSTRVEIAVAVGESFLVGALLAALFECISRYLHRPKV